MAMTVRYCVKTDAAQTDQAQSSFTTQALTVGLTAAQANEVASSLQRAAQLIESGPDRNDKQEV